MPSRPKIYPAAFKSHPKLTPYRLAFITITSGLGISKAVLVSYNRVASSITVEWIAGVVVALILQFLSEYEYKPHRSGYVKWLFSYDCLNIPKRFIHQLGPTYIDQAQSGSLHHNASENPENISSTSKMPPIVTAYRVFVSASVISLGLAKMTCGYLGFSTAMNTLDWIVTVPLTLGLYYTGLYEENESSVPRKFFDIEYIGIARLSLLTGLLYIGAVIACVFWIKLWSKNLQGVVASFKAVSSGPESLWEIRSLHLPRWMLIIFSLGMLGVGAAGLDLLLWPMLRACTGRHTISIRRYTAQLANFALYLFLAFLFAEFSLIIIMSCPDKFHEFFGPNADTDLWLPYRVLLAGFIICSIPVPAFMACTFAFRAFKALYKST